MAKKGIQTFKGHFHYVLCCVDDSFPKKPVVQDHPINIYESEPDVAGKYDANNICL